jgi:hypothetical protein
MQLNLTKDSSTSVESKSLGITGEELGTTNIVCRKAKAAGSHPAASSFL